MASSASPIFHPWSPQYELWTNPNKIMNFYLKIIRRAKTCETSSTLNVPREMTFDGKVTSQSIKSYYSLFFILHGVVYTAEGISQDTTINAYLNHNKWLRYVYSFIVPINIMCALQFQWLRQNKVLLTDSMYRDQLIRNSKMKNKSYKKVTWPQHIALYKYFAFITTVKSHLLHMNWLTNSNVLKHSFPFI